MVHLSVTLSCERWGAGKVVRVPPDVASLFEPAPDQWGLRGDPYLWDELAAKFHGVPRPASREHLESLLVAAIRSAAGVGCHRPRRYRPLHRALPARRHVTQRNQPAGMEGTTRSAVALSALVHLTASGPEKSSSRGRARSCRAQCAQPSRVLVRTLSARPGLWPLVAAMTSAGGRRQTRVRSPIFPERSKCIRG
jgi:hypothetical protein